MSLSNRSLQRHRIMATLPSTGRLKPASSSLSLPDLRACIKPNAMGMGLPKANVTGKSQVRVIGASKSVSSIQFPYLDQGRSRLTVPNFGHSKGESAPKLPSHHDMILGVLRAGASHCQRGMKWNDILDVLYFVYPNVPKTRGSVDSLKRSLENAVAKGVVSRVIPKVSHVQILRGPILIENYVLIEVLWNDAVRCYLPDGEPCWSSCLHFRGWLGFESRRQWDWNPTSFGIKSPSRQRTLSSIRK